MTSPISQSLSQALACTVDARGIDAILVFDASRELLDAIEAFLLACLGCQEAVHVGPTTDDDSFWGTYRVDKKGQPYWTAGLLGEGAATKLFVIRDLAAVSLEVQRTLVMLVGADSAHLERHGQSRSWRPRALWVAACARRDIGKISPHLLDRFVVRLEGSSAEKPMTAKRLRELVKRSEKAQRSVDEQRVDDLEPVPHAPVKATPPVQETALDRVLEYFPVSRGSTRRTITLARLAAATARFAAASEVTAAHVDSAATLIGLTPPAPKPTENKPPLPIPPPPVPGPAPVVQAGPVVTQPGPALPQPGTTDQRVVVSHERLETGKTTPALPAVPYQEDTAPVEREQRALAIPAIQQRATVRATRGVAIGVMRTQELRDLSLSATILEAAKHRGIRGELRITPGDLRRYRRMAPVERILTVLLDYTALGGWDWGGAVLPYLRNAYVQRASICFVQVGTAEDELRAHRYVSRSMRHAPIDHFLNATAGRATPLAHGLDLAFETIRHTLQHGRSVAVEAQLLVVTDGRGNVPLDTSRRGGFSGPVRDEGVRDAISVATKLRYLARLKSVLIQPPPTVAAELPLKLADAMGAERRMPRLPEPEPRQKTA